jgi:signal transduction histidine kinase
VEARLEEEPELSLDAKEALYRVAQEAIHNVVKHAEASRVWLTLKSRPEAVLLEVQDDGKGFDPTQDFPGHLGQRSMRERSEAIGAGLTVESAPGQGTRVRVWLPLQTQKSR